MDAADANDSGGVSGLSDGLFLLFYGFVDRSPPPAPGPEECGVDPTNDDDITCADTSACEGTAKTP